MDEARFEVGEERELWAAYQAAAAQLAAAKQPGVAEFVAACSPLVAPIDAYFDKVGLGGGLARCELAGVRGVGGDWLPACNRGGKVTARAVSASRLRTRPMTAAGRAPRPQPAPLARCL